MQHTGKYRRQFSPGETGGFTMMDEYDDLLTTGEACEALRVGFNTLYRLLHSGQLKAYRCGRVWRIPKAAVVAFVRDSANLPPQASGSC